MSAQKDKPTFYEVLGVQENATQEECLQKLDDLTTTYKVLYIRFCAFDYQQFDIIDKMFVVDENMIKLLEKASEENFYKIFIKFANITGDYSLLNSSKLDYLIENGDIICFEKNKKPILNKSSKFNCYLNVEMKTLSSYLSFQLVEMKASDIKNFQNSGIFNKRFN